MDSLLDFVHVMEAHYPDICRKLYFINGNIFEF